MLTSIRKLCRGLACRGSVHSVAATRLSILMKSPSDFPVTTTAPNFGPYGFVQQHLQIASDNQHSGTWICRTATPHLRTQAKQQKSSLNTAGYPSISLHEAAEKGDLEGLKTGLDNVWMHIDLPDKNGLTPLARAALSLQADAVQCLIDNGADARVCMGNRLHESAGILASLVQAQKPLDQDPADTSTVSGRPKDKQPAEVKIYAEPQLEYAQHQIARMILSAFPECMDNDRCSSMGGLVQGRSKVHESMEKTRKFATGPYEPINGKHPGARLEFAVDMFFKVNRCTSVTGVVKAMEDAGTMAQVVDKSYALEAEDKPALVSGKPGEWKVVQWSKGEWQLIGANSPIGRGDAHLKHVSRVFKTLKEIAAIDKIWIVNVGLRDARGCYSLHHLQSLCVRFAMCESGLRRLLPCPVRTFHEDETIPVIDVWKTPSQPPHKAFDAIYNANSYGRLVRLVGDESMLKLNEIESLGIAQFLSAGGAPNFIDLENWIRTLHWFVGTSSMAIPMSTRQNPDDPDEALQFILNKLVADPLLAQWAWNRRQMEMTTKRN